MALTPPLLRHIAESVDVLDALAMSWTLWISSGHSGDVLDTGDVLNTGDVLDTVETSWTLLRRPAQSGEVRTL